MAWAPTYVDTSEMLAYLRIGDTQDNTEVALAIEAASRTIDQETGRQFGVTASTQKRVYEVCWDAKLGLWYADIDDVQTLTGFVVEVEGNTLASSAYQLGPRNALLKGRPYEQLWIDDATSSDLTGERTVEVTGTWGWTAVPDTIKNACLLQVNRLFKRRDSPFGVAGSPDFGTELRLLPKLDPDVQKMIRPYWRLSKSRMFA